LSLPDDIKKRLNLESRQRGRIWRIVPEKFKAKKFERMDTLSTWELAKHLLDSVAWQRLYAQRLLMGRKNNELLKALGGLDERHLTAASIVHLMWLYDGLGWLESDVILTCLRHKNSGVRETGLRLAEQAAGRSDAIQKYVLGLSDDPDSHVRLQVAFSLGALPPDIAGPALAKLLMRPDADSWLQSAVLSSAKDAAPYLLEALLKAKSPSAVLITRITSMVGARGEEAQIAHALKLLGTLPGDSPLPMALLDGLGQGMQNSKRPLAALWDYPPPALKDSIEQALAVFQKAAAVAKDEKTATPQKLSAVRLLTSGPPKVANPALVELLAAQHPLEVQTAAVRALSSRAESEVTPALMAAFNQAGPSLRRELLEALCARPDRIGKLLDELEAKKIAAAQIEPARIQFLKTHPNADLKRRALATFAGLGDSDRRKVVESYKEALALKPDIAKGKMLFAKHCAACHRLDDVGQEVGANLKAALGNKTKEALLVDILDPSREVDSRFVNYRVTTSSGLTITGILAVESPSSITLRRAEKAEDTILRNQIDTIEATAKSLMPDEFEKLMTKQEVADLIEYLLGAGK
jgi:putative heme-binding domain-containing protein